VNEHDPVLARRARVARLTETGQRVGYGLFGLAIALFIAAALTSFTSALVAGITTCLAVGSLVLAPSIVFGYAVKAAEREDRDNETRRRE
jgi:high-affinity Fe2+/Pb2+ permease